MKKLLLTCLFNTMFTLPGHAQTATSQPLVLEFYIGGFLGGSHRLTVTHGELLYTHHSSSDPNIPGKTITLNVDEAAWKQFRSALDKINVWRWEKTYFNNAAQDGTQWNLKVTYPDATIESSGSNGYPNANGSFSPEQAGCFKALLQALSELTGKDIR